jgi:hypothetical protein
VGLLRGKEVIDDDCALTLQYYRGMYADAGALMLRKGSST